MTVWCILHSSLHIAMPCHALHCIVAHAILRQLIQFSAFTGTANTHKCIWSIQMAIVAALSFIFFGVRTEFFICLIGFVFLNCIWRAGFAFFSLDLNSNHYEYISFLVRMSMAARVFMFIWTQLSVSMLCYYHCAYLHRAMNCNVCHHLYESFEIWLMTVCMHACVCMCVCAFFSWSSVHAVYHHIIMVSERMSTYFQKQQQQQNRQNQNGNSEQNTNLPLPRFYHLSFYVKLQSFPPL